MVRTLELQVSYIGFYTFDIVADYESVNCKLKISFRVPRSVSIATAWNRFRFAVRSYDSDSIRYFIIGKWFCPTVVVS